MQGSPITTLLLGAARRIGPSLSSPIWIADGNVHIEVEDALTGKLLREELVHNKVVVGGRNILRDLLLNIGPPPNFMAVGSGGTAPQDDNVQLEAEIFRAQPTRKLSYQSRAAFKLFLKTVDANGPGPGAQPLREVGLFARANYTDSGALGGGLLFSRAVFSQIDKDSTVQVTFTWDYSIGSSG